MNLENLKPLDIVESYNLNKINFQYIKEKIQVENRYKEKIVIT